MLTYKIRSLIIFIIIVSFNDLYGQVTFIPDNAFEQALIDLGHDSDGTINGQVSTSDISTLTQLEVSSKNISSLCGIEDFVALVDLFCHSNDLTNLNISNLTSLQNLWAFDNDIDNLNLPSGATLKTLYCGTNNLAELDLTGNAGIIDLECFDNNLTTLDLSTNLGLLLLRANGNALTNFPAGLELLTGLVNVNLSDNDLSGCWPSELDFLCPLLATDEASFDGNVYDGEINFISTQGFIDFCNDPDFTCNCGHPDFSALEAFYDALDGDNWNDNTGWLEDCDPCGEESGTPWFGIRCENNSNRVNAISLNNNNLTGPLHAEIGDFNQLASLSLQGNNIGGPIPAEIGNFPLLEVLNLQSCQITGTLPSSICNLNLLTQFKLGINSMHGDLPPCLENLHDLIFFSVRNNSFTGPLPNFDADQSVLDQIELFDNDFTGPIPAGYGDLTPSLLSLGNNDLSGAYDDNLLNLCPLGFPNANISSGTNLDEPWEVFCCNHPNLNPLRAIYHALDGENWTNNDGWLTDCDPCGLIDGTPWYGLTCDNSLDIVTEINLTNNALSGMIPNEIGLLEQLQSLILKGNNISGVIPDELCLILELQVLQLASNSLSGAVPDCIADNINIQEVILTDNQLTGSLPPFDEDNVNLVNIDLDQNSFSGSIPISYADLSALNRLKVADNINLTGPYALDLGALCELDLTNEWISDGTSFDQAWEDFCSTPCAYVPDDNFELALQALGYDSGPLDDCVPILNIDMIIALDVSGEGIEDLTGIEFFTALEVLDVSDNDLIELDLVENSNLTSVDAHNNMIACFNLNAVALPDLTALDVSDNNIAGCWPEEMLPFCDQLTSFDFDGNYFDGSTNYISNQGWVNFCTSELGVCGGSFDGWSPLGNGLNRVGFFGGVFGVTIDETGNVYAGGSFTQAGGQSANRIAKWNPNTEEWSPLGTGLNSTVIDVTIDETGNVYAGGDFTQAGGQSANHIAKWDPNTEEWSPLGNGFNRRVSNVAIDVTGNVYAGGSFTQAGGQSANRIAKWNTSTEQWSPLGNGLNSAVHDMAIDETGNVYAGGDFTQAGGQSANRIAKWDPNTEEWSPLGNGFNRRVSNVAIDDTGNVYAGGDFTQAGGQSANRIAKWDPNTEEWSPLGTGLNRTAVRA